ncbi:glycine cleavage system aminomethyltransferase GcvT [Desulfoluna butyratoxydans]|uniref:Pyridoxal phosphate-dependent transferase n=1 Tax=Desulfoluna butyratoxydans TaxID=231438 RepID=A0A4U8YNH9_9BACT|nr:glycine cleavage system aminomethyltransferase GcvT [Desulfoluna butyratoxydans]VFQ45675.1 pyridoxal phosphate-dependent transferase [Desulfoluna butyratoxydans]
MTELHRTPFFTCHLRAGARLVPFGGWEMPLEYPSGIVAEHLTTRKKAGLFDVSHMGRFVVSGDDALGFLQHVLTNNAAALAVGEAQYTMIPTEGGGAVDDAYLYRFQQEGFLLVVNAANRTRDWHHFQAHLEAFQNVSLHDATFDQAMLSLQGPASKTLLGGLLEEGALPEPRRNALSEVKLKGVPVRLARTGYTGEPLCFELFCDTAHAEALWEMLVAEGAEPIGLGARDTLRLEAGLPLYGHELGQDPDGGEIPVFACPLARFAVSLSPLKGDFVGREALTRQHRAFSCLVAGDDSLKGDLPRMAKPLALTGKGIARQGCRVFRRGAPVGYVSSGTMVPYWVMDGEGIRTHLTGEKGRRAICIAMVDSDLREGQALEVEIRGKMSEAVIVPCHMRSDAPPYARPVLADTAPHQDDQDAMGEVMPKVRALIKEAADNTAWRQGACINLIPSEQSVSPVVKLLSVMDPAGRYAEHKKVAALKDAEVFYYQGTDFIARAEAQLEVEMRTFLGCAQAETRVISGQMANTAVFSAMVDYLNRADRKTEQRRMRRVMNHHIMKGGHLSAQPMGALRDFIARDPRTEKPAVVNFPVLGHNPFKVDVDACRWLLEAEKPELIIFGKSMVLHKEPVREIRAMVDELGLDAVLMYDMAHVLGLAGPWFQEPFAEGADLVTGSTHKTFFGPQRGVITADMADDDPRLPLWDAITRRTFPGSVSNHHLGTLLGLCAAAMEMNAFKQTYQKKVLENARYFAQALADCGLEVAGDPAEGYTETHQVIIKVGYAKGPEAARHLEENNILVNYQAVPEEEGFTASGALRTGVQEMTRFGMEKEDFGALAELMADVLINGKGVRDEVAAFRGRFTQMRYCFRNEELDGLLEQLHQWI